MKTFRFAALLMGLIATIVIISCQKSDVSNRSGSQPEGSAITVSTQSAVLLENGSRLTSSGVTITAPDQVNVDETFNITAAIDCGKVSIERGYILAADNVTKIYNGLTCASANLLWDEAPFQCYTDDASWSGSFGEAGTYVFRTKHNGNDGNCDGQGGQNTAGECSFSGNRFCCFVIEAVEACQTSFTGEAFFCGLEREAAFTFTSKDAHDYIKIQGGLTNFTGEDATVYINGTVVEFSTPSADGWVEGTVNGYTVGQRTQGGSSNRNIRVEGGVTECDELVIRIVWASSNAGGVITGSWSVKDSNGVELAPPVAGLTCGN